MEWRTAEVCACGMMDQGTRVFGCDLEHQCSELLKYTDKADGWFLGDQAHNHILLISAVFPICGW